MLRGWTTAPVHQGKRARSFVWIPLHLASTEWQGGIGHVKTLKSKVKLQRVERREETTWLGTSKGAQETVSAASSAMDRGWELWHPLETDKPSILGPQSDSERKRDSPFRIPTPTTREAQHGRQPLQDVFPWRFASFTGQECMLQGPDWEQNLQGQAWVEMVRSHEENKCLNLGPFGGVMEAKKSRSDQLRSLHHLLAY